MEIEKMTVKITFTEDILGSLPADENLLTRFVSSKIDDPLLQSEEGDCIPERSRDSGHTVFPEDDQGIFLWNYQVKGFLKEAANNMKLAVGVKNLRSKINNFVFITERRIRIKRDGQNILEPDSILERPLRAQTMQGPRVSLVGSERIECPAELILTFDLIHNKEVSMDIIRQLLNYGQYKGIGQWHNGGWGTFSWAEVK